MVFIEIVFSPSVFHLISPYPFSFILSTLCHLTWFCDTLA